MLAPGPRAPHTWSPAPAGLARAPARVGQQPPERRAPLSPSWTERRARHPPPEGEPAEEAVGAGGLRGSRLRRFPTRVLRAGALLWARRGDGSRSSEELRVRVGRAADAGSPVRGRGCCGGDAGVWTPPEGDAESPADGEDSERRSRGFGGMPRGGRSVGRTGCLGEAAGQVTRVQRDGWRALRGEPRTQPGGLGAVLEEVGRQRCF